MSKRLLPVICLLFLTAPVRPQEDASDLRQKSTALVAAGRYADAVPLLERALAIEEKDLGADDPALAPVAESLAAVYRAQGRNPDAETLYNRASAIKEKAAGANSIDLIADLKPLAGVYTAEGRNPDAERALLRIIAIRVSAKGDDDPDLVFRPI